MSAEEVAQNTANQVLNQIQSHAPQAGSLNIRKFYEGKNVLLSGCTDFLGKVILEKLMRTCPEINKFYIMVRAKRNKEPFDRIKNEILNSYVFSVVKKQHQDFYSWA